MSKSTFPTQPILAIPWIEPCNLVVPILTKKKKKKINQYLYENCKGNRDYDLNSNNEIVKVEIRNRNREIDDELSFLRNVKRKSWGNR